MKLTDGTHQNTAGANCNVQHTDNQTLLGNACLQCNQFQANYAWTLGSMHGQLLLVEFRVQAQHASEWDTEIH